MQVLAGVRIVAVSICSHKQTLLFSYIVGSPFFLKDTFFPDYLEVAKAFVVPLELVKLLLVHRYTVDILAHLSHWLRVSYCNH